MTTRLIPALSRRRLLAAAAVGGGTAALPLRPGLDTARSAGVPRRTPVARAATFARTAVPSRATRHVLSRLSYGVTPQLSREALDLGGPQSWFETQLAYGNIADPFANGLDSWWPKLSWAPMQIGAANLTGQISGFELLNDFKRWSLMRRVYSRRQLHEVMVEFWSNHLHITTPESKSLEHRINYDRVIRSHALGKYDALLTAAITHPAMLCYLDAARSTAKAPNENLGRELLELHTVGKESAFTEQDVADSTRILTGWRVASSPTWDPYYSSGDHYLGRVQVMGFAAGNTSPYGQGVTRDYLAYLAHHPLTAQRIARKLAVRFVSDAPSVALVDHLAGVFTRSGTDIAATLRALVAHPEFAAAAGQKVRTPAEDVVATFRVLQIQTTQPTGGEADAASAILHLTQALGETPFGWPRPDGAPDINDAWSSASRLLSSWRVHSNLAGGYYPSTGVKYKPTAAWLPALPVRFDGLVDHLCRRLLARRSSVALLDTACAAVDALPGERITADHPLVQWRMPLLLDALLDTPQHMSR